MSKPSKPETKKPDPAIVAPEKPPEGEWAPPVSSEAEKPPEAAGAAPGSASEGPTLEEVKAAVAELEAGNLPPDPDGVYRAEHRLDPLEGTPEFQAMIDEKVAEMIASMTDGERESFRIAVVRAFGLLDPEAEKRAAHLAAVSALVGDGAFDPHSDEPKFYQVMRPGSYASEGSVHHLALGSIVGRSTHPIDHIRASNEIVLHPLPVS
jgi:hypothetical protein